MSPFDRLRVNGVVLAGLLAAASAWAEDAEPAPVEAEENASEGYSPKDEQTSLIDALKFSGYLDVGFVAPMGNGSSWVAEDARQPADYGVDTFATAVNSRGEVASTNTNGRYHNGFLPRSVGIGGRPSFLLNTLSADLRFAPPQVPVMIFARVQVLPRFEPGGDPTRVELQQAFGRVTPFSSEEFTIALGKFDSVFGIEYLENEANLRTGITPSLIARYTTGQGLGAKVFYRLQLAPLWSAISLNAAATVGGTRVESLMNPHLSLSGAPVGSARLGYELNLQRVQLKLGVSGLLGPRNDQRDASVLQQAIGADLRLTFLGLFVAAEFIHLYDQQGTREGKSTPLGDFDFASAFMVNGFYGTLGWKLPLEAGFFNGLTIYARYDHRRAQFKGFRWVEVNRITGGLRLDLFNALAIKAEYLFNGELVGVPDVPNDVFTTSAVFSW
jgi:hypothetical protein